MLENSETNMSRILPTKHPIGTNTAPNARKTLLFSRMDMENNIVPYPDVMAAMIKILRGRSIGDRATCIREDVSTIMAASIPNTIGL